MIGGPFNSPLVRLSALEQLTAPLQAEDATAIFVALDGRHAGVLTLADPLKPTTPQALPDLRALGVDVLMLTGDNRRTAETVARKLGIQDFEAGVTPSDKHEKIKALKGAGRIVGMAGDGINDAPALVYPFFGLLLSPVIAGVAMSFSSVSVIVNALRLRKVKR